MMETDWTTMADRVLELERHSTRVATDWYEFGPIHDDDVRVLEESHEGSLATLESIAQRLDSGLKASHWQGSAREHAQYAYEVTQELIQSRRANMEMLQSLTSRDNVHPEFGRAIALKERGAMDQASKLRAALQALHTGVAPGPH